jgi:hypothetical protein
VPLRYSHILSCCCAWHRETGAIGSAQFPGLNSGDPWH